MRSNFIAAAIASAALTFLTAPFLAEPASTLLHGAVPDLPTISGGMELSAVPVWWLSGGFAAYLDGILAVWALCLLAIVLIALSTAPNRRADDGGVLGSARVKTGEEVLRGSETWDGRRSPRSRGFVYGFHRGRYLYEPERFVLVDGATGSGKTRFCLIPTLDLLTFGDGSGGSEPHTVVVSDVKNELIELTGDALESRGYRVLLLDLQHPMRGHRYNPLSLVLAFANAGRLHDAEQAADSIAAALVPSEDKGGSSHWVESARSLASALVMLVALSPDCPEGARNMATVADILNRGTEGEGQDPSEPLKELFRSLPPDHPARSRASQLLSSGGNELRSILSTLKVHMRVFASGPIAWMTSGCDIDPRALLNEKTALFLHVLDEGSPYNAICTMLLDQLYSALHMVADDSGGSLPRPVTIVGDEWGNLPTVRSLPSLLSLGRSYRCFWAGAVQNMAQLNKYGERDGRRKILANCGVKVALKLGEAEDRQYFTELVGKTTRHTQGTSTNRSAHGGGSSMSYSEHADDVIHPWEWTQMSPDRDGAIVVKMAENGVPPSHAGTFRAPLADCTKMPTKRHFDLGTREHERTKRMACQARLNDRAAVHEGERVDVWCLEFPADELSDEKQSDGWDGLALD